MSLPPVEIPLGAMRFNSDSQKLEYFNGDVWMQVHTFSPIIDGGTRGFVSGGAHPGTNAIEYITISIGGNASDFGDIASTNKYCSGGSSNTRGIIGGGEEGGATDRIQYHSLSSTGNTTDFGNLAASQTYIAGCSNQTRLVWGGGKDSSNNKNNIMTYVTIASTGDSKDFGDITQVRSNIGALSNPTRGLFAGGYTPTQVNTIDYITIASTGDAQDFGDISNGIGVNSAQCASTTRGIIWGGDPAGTNIDFLTIATLGHTTDFGESTINLSYRNCTSDCVRGISFGGQDGPGARNTIEYITISTTGDATDFGDLATDQHHAAASYSTGHGGLG